MKDHYTQSLDLYLEKVMGNFTKNCVGLPANILKRDRSSVGVNEAGQARNKPLKSHSLSANVVVEDLRWIEILQRCPWICLVRHSAHS